MALVLADFFADLQDFALQWSGVATFLFMGAMIFFFWRTLKLMPKTKPRRESTSCSGAAFTNEADYELRGEA